MNSIALIGLALDGIGTALVIAGVVAGGEARWGLIITGAILCSVGVYVYITGRKVGGLFGEGPRLVRTGSPTTAIVERMWETGVTVNDSPVFGFGLQVTRERQAPYSAQVQQAVPRMLVGAVLPGATLAVRVDPADPSRVAIDWASARAAGGRPAIVPGAATAAVAGASAAELAEAVRDLPPEQRGDAAALLAHGRRATARITGARAVGTAGDLKLVPAGDPRAGDEMLLLDLEVKIPGRDPYPASVLHRVPSHLLGRVGPGLEVQVAVSRDDPEHDVAIDWEALP